MCQRENLTDNIEGRYLLKIKLNNDFTNILTIAMMNPSKANENCSDDTINKMISFVFEKNLNSPVSNIGYINIINIFPAYEPNSGDVKEKLDEIIKYGKLEYMQERNKIAFDTALSESNYVVLAWGDVPKKVKARFHSHEVLMMYDLIIKYGLEKSTYVLKYEKIEKILTNKKRPRHPSRNNPESYVKVNSIKVWRNFLYIDVNNE